jgi:hypothetical protein
MGVLVLKFAAFFSSCASSVYSSTGLIPPIGRAISFPSFRAAPFPVWARPLFLVQSGFWNAKSELLSSEWGRSVIGRSREPVGLGTCGTVSVH